MAWQRRSYEKRMRGCVQHPPHGGDPPGRRSGPSQHSSLPLAGLYWPQGYRTAAAAAGSRIAELSPVAPIDNDCLRSQQVVALAPEH